jgi:outer membrane protein assembly factor BamE
MNKNAVILAAALLVGGCSMPNLAPYKIDVQQGNVVTQEMVAKLKPGMTKSQVRFVLGTPLVTDAFHADRWDYVYQLRKQGKLTEQRRLTVIFEQDLLKRVEGDVQAATPEEMQAMQEIKGEKPKLDQPKPAADASDDAKAEAEKAPAEEKGFWGRMMDKIGL